MMADFVDQHVAYEVRQVFVELAPVIEDWAAIQKYHVDARRRVRDAALVYRHTLIQTEQVERAFELHLAANLRVGKILDADYDVFRVTAQARRDDLPGGIGERANIGQRRRGGRLYDG